MKGFAIAANGSKLDGKDICGALQFVFREGHDPNGFLFKRVGDGFTHQGEVVAGDLCEDNEEARDDSGLGFGRPVSDGGDECVPPVALSALLPKLPR